MDNKICRKSSVLQSGVIKAAWFLLFVAWILPALSFGATPGEWIKLAENACIYEKSYKVSRKTEVFHESVNKDKAAKIKKLISKGSAQLAYTKKKGLKPIPPKKDKDKASGSPRPSVFTLDISYMLQKMRGKAQWVLEKENEIHDKQDCVVLSSSGEKWLVRLWIRKKDGAVLRYDQYLNNRFLGTSRVEYGPRRKKKHFPAKTTTRFNLTNHIIVQHYGNYVFSEDDE